jgi:cobalt-zinc-cadmium efflux system membrane fusion protein
LKNASTWVSFVKDDTEVFNVADLRTVWVNLNVPPADVTFVEKGQRCISPPVHISLKWRAKLATLALSSLKTHVRCPVRAELSNPDGRWRPGLFVTARLTTKETTASVLIRKPLFRRLKGSRVSLSGYRKALRARAVTLGQSNETHTEITAGLAAGERYAATETFVLKADLAKSEAEHQH